ncbi:YfiT family bacillithiol transferase [Cohnella sp.]|uniref:YfiT family bacillithiol transferase n=1 Tax=Cohnella sp. TaxID=1883426 RepID=UPI0037044C68
MEESIRYPIGRFEPIDDLTGERRLALIEEIPGLANQLRKLIAELPPERLLIPYREGGWTIAQIVHHLADNDMNAYLRFKRALTEEEPLASSYREDLWAELPDYRKLPPEHSLLLLEILHARFATLLADLEPAAFRRKLRTQVLGSVTLDVAMQRLVWHNRHHRAQIEVYLNGRD